MLFKLRGQKVTTSWLFLTTLTSWTMHRQRTFLKWPYLSWSFETTTPQWDNMTTECCWITCISRSRDSRNLARSAADFTKLVLSCKSSQTLGRVPAIRSISAKMRLRIDVTKRFLGKKYALISLNIVLLIIGRGLVLFLIRFHVWQSYFLRYAQQSLVS